MNFIFNIESSGGPSEPSSPGADPAPWISAESQIYHDFNLDINI